MPETPQPFRFTDPRHERIYRRLLLLGQGPADFFRDACRLMQEQDGFISTSHLVGHLCRDIESALKDIISPKQVKEQPKARRGRASCGKPEDHKNRVEACLQALGIPLDSPEAKAWLSFSQRDAGLARLAHRDALRQARPMDGNLRSVWEQFQLILDAVLDAVERRYIHWHRIADELAVLAEPTARDLARIRNNLPNNAGFRGDLFKKVTSWRWLPFLLKEGFFETPPGPQRVPGRDSIRFPDWPESRLLVRMARVEEAQACVLDIALSIPATENIYVQSDLVDVALSLPPALAAKLGPHVAWYARSPFRSLTQDKLADLIVHLARGGFIDVALDVARLLLEVRPASADSTGLGPAANMDAHDYNDALQKIVRPLAEAAGIRSLDVLSNLLTGAIQASRTHDEDGESPHDLSWAWRPAIEEHQQNAGEYDIRACLARAVRDATDHLVSTGGATVPEVLGSLESREWSVFKRVALHLLRVHGAERLDLVETRLINKDSLDDPGLRHEYALLAAAHFGRLPQAARDQFLQWIDAGPQTTSLRRQDGTPFSPADQAHYAQQWRRDLLSFVKDSLPPPWAARYAQLIAQYGPPQHPDLLSYWSVGRGGGDSPRTVDELRGLSVQDLITFLRTWQQPGTAWDGPTLDGLAGALAATVRTDTATYTAAARQFAEVPLRYTAALLQGLRDVVDGGAGISWPEVLALMHDVLQRLVASCVAPEHDRADARSVKMATLRLVDLGLRKSNSGLLPADRRGVWDVLLPLTDDPEPDTVSDEEGSDFMTRSLNTTRGEAIHAVIHYALWVRRMQHGDAPDRPPATFDQMPEVRSVLNAHLDPSRDASPTIRAAFGVSVNLFAFLDMPWLRDAIVRIFPADPPWERLRSAAWEAYAVFSHAERAAFALLHGEYAAAIEGLSAHRAGAGRDPGPALAFHLMTAYWNGWIDLDSVDGLLQRFHAVAPDEVQAHGIEAVGRELWKRKEPLPTETRERLERLWEARVLAVEQVPVAHKEEATGFGAWFACGLLDSDKSMSLLTRLLRVGTFPHLDHAVMERLALTIATHPLDTLECVDHLIENDVEGWHFWSWRSEARPLFEAALGSGDAQVKKLATELISKLASRGFLDFRDLLP